LNSANKIKAFILALFLQACIAALIFFGGLLDPLLGLGAAGIYFFVIGFYLMYRYVLISILNQNKIKQITQ
jgi:hypothetical protein